MLKSDISIEKVEDITAESGCACGGSCACGNDAETKTEKIETVASGESCGCGNGGCC
jgi:hypothetical protein